MTHSESPNLRAAEHPGGFQVPARGLAAVEPPGQDLLSRGRVVRWREEVEGSEENNKS